MQIKDLEQMIFPLGFEPVTPDLACYRPMATEKEPWYFLRSDLTKPQNFEFRSCINGELIQGVGKLFKVIIPLLGAYPEVGKLEFSFLYQYRLGAARLGGIGQHFASPGIPHYETPFLQASILEWLLAEMDARIEFCPRCQVPMATKLSKKLYATDWFWGCLHYPHCRGTRSRTPLQPHSLPQRKN